MTRVTGRQLVPTAFPPSLAGWMSGHRRYSRFLMRTLSRTQTAARSRMRECSRSSDRPDRPRRCRSCWRQRSQSFASAATTRRLPRVLRRRHLLARSRMPLELHHCVADASALHFAVAADGLFVCCAAQAMPPALLRTDRAVHALMPTRRASPRRSTRPASRSESAVPVPAVLPRVFRGPFDG